MNKRETGPNLDSSDFGWGLPALPCISGRDLAGKIVKAPAVDSRFKIGDNVWPGSHMLRTLVD